MTDYRRELREFISTAIQNQLNADSIQATQPSWITTDLRPHQRTLLAAALSIEDKSRLQAIASETPQMLTKYGVLADRVGSGKSLVALGLVLQEPPENTRVIVNKGNAYSDAMTISIKCMPPCFDFLPEWSDLSADTLKSVLDTAAVDGRYHTRTAFAIVPHNICAQWESYIRDHTKLNATIIKRTKDCDYDRPDFMSCIFSADLVLVSSTMLKKFMAAVSFKGISFDHIVWSRLFVDEADSIVCTTRYYDITARFTWFISASWLNMLLPSGMHSFAINSLPDDLRQVLGSGIIAGVSSRYGFIYNTLADTRAAPFARLILRNSDAWIESSLQTPVIRHETILCKSPANLAILSGFISASAMEALHAGDTAGALEALGLKTASKETLVERVTAGLRGDIAQAERLLEFKRTMEYSTPAVKVAAIEKAEQKVVRLQEQLVALESRVAAATQDVCPICYDTLRTPTLTPCCRQSFCLSCLCECMTTKPACPLCRAPIASVSELLVLGSDTMEASVIEVAGPPTKGAALLELLQNSSEDQRFLVFSAHEASFKGLRELLSARGIRCELLSGSGARVERLRTQFRDGTIRVLCMNARHVGAGINLEAATHVVLYHRMNTELEKQVIGRAVRFERTAELKIVHLVHETETALNGSQSSEVIMHV